MIPRVILLLLSGLFMTLHLSAQNIGINETGANPHGSAILDVSSSNKGMLVPRLTTAQRTGIAGPANGLLVYDTNSTSFWFYDGGAWVELVSGTVGGNTLDEAYNQGGPGAGRIITANSGTVSIQGNAGFEVTGNFGSGPNIGNPGAGTRMFFNPRKAAFRAGTVNGNQWNNATVGDYSAAFGLNTRASGEAAFAAGSGSQANSNHSIALGLNNLAGSTGAVAIGSSNNVFFQGGVALGTGNSVGASYGTALGFEHTLSGSYAAAIGYQNTTGGISALSFGYQTEASANYATAFGNNTAASALLSTAFGHNTRAESYASYVLGRYNQGGGNANSWVATDPVFEVGIGSTPANLNNAMTILKNGNTGIGTHTPSATLHVDGSVRIENGTQAAGRILVSDANGNATWVDAPASGGTLDDAYDFGGAGNGRIITADAGVVSIQGNAGFEVTGNFGSGPNIGNPGAGTRMFFNPRKAAFRAGNAFGNEWNQANVGDYSSAFGRGHTASGISSFAAGWSNLASGDYSVSLGINNGSTGVGAVTIGDSNLASNIGAFASGRESGATGLTSVALGEACWAVGDFSVAMGNQTFSDGTNAVSMGNTAQATGDNSVAIGNGALATGFASTAFGSSTHAESHTSFALGTNNIGGGNPTSWVAADPLFEIGNGVNSSNKSNAVTVLKNGNTGIGTHTPSATLHVDGSVRIENGTQAAGRILVSDANGNATWVDAPASGGTLDDAYDFGGAGNGRIITADAGVVSIQGNAGFEVTGNFGSGPNIGNPGAGTRMFFNPRKAAFRAGRAVGNEWNQANVGNYSTAMGYGNTAIGESSFAAGDLNNVSGSFAVGLGTGNIVSGEAAVAIGESNSSINTGSFASGQNSSATGVGSIALGESCIASGQYAIAMGNQSEASGGSSVALGKTAQAVGQNSTAFGNSTVANGFSSSAFGGAVADAQYSFALGRFNEGGGSSNSWVPTDPLFEIGNGVSPSNRNNAVTVLKNGNTGIGTATPEASLHVEGSMRYEDGQEGEGRVLVSDNDGNAAWSESIGFSTIRTSPVTLSQGDAIVFTFAYHNRGNAYNPTTGEFTAPVEGLYQFHYIEHNNAAANANTGITIQRNGTFYKQLHTIQVVSSTRYANTITWAMELDDGDVVTIELLGSTRTLSGSGGGAAIKSSFEGFLVR